MINRILAIALVATVAMSCGSAKTPTRTLEKAAYAQPGINLLNESKSGMFRAWAVGKSDTEMAAHSKAVALASSDLSEMLEKTVLNTIESTFVEVGEGDISSSKSLMTRSLNTISSQVLKGATIIYDTWGEKGDDGMYKNYIVLELKGENVVNALYDKYVELSDDSTVKIDKELLNAKFTEAVDKK